MTLTSARSLYSKLGVSMVIAWLVLGSTGCSTPTTIDEIQLVNCIGYDKLDKGYQGSALYPTFEQQNMTKANMMATISNSNYDILPRLNSKSSLPVEQGQLRIVVFGEEFAKEGITVIVNSLIRDPAITSRLHLAVAENTAEKLLQRVVKTNDSYFLSTVIEQNIETQNIPSSNLHHFLYQYYGEGRDPYLPYFIQDKDQSIKLDGLAIFRKDRYVGRINLRESFLLKLMLNETTAGRYQVHVNKEGKKGYILLRNLAGKTSFDLTMDDEQVPSVSVHMRVDAMIKDYPPWLDLTKKENLKWVEKKFETHFSEQIEQLVQRFITWNVDPIGFGEKFRSHKRNWNARTFYEKYEDLQLTAHTEVNVLQTGIGE
ncbi:Ger(x)C family spore germination protein [Marinicrinis sediminis]|uniref:Ger(X)C family spore germination protein n=1 Tax=Marinicrinis sediminis TaxID=1652465 RepID=A0ABW5REE5_9BACL